MPTVQVLDFYVDESRQRCGIGLALFEGMLTHEKVEPRDIGIQSVMPHEDPIGPLPTLQHTTGPLRSSSTSWVNTTGSTSTLPKPITSSSSPSESSLRQVPIRQGF